MKKKILAVIVVLAISLTAMAGCTVSIGKTGGGNNPTSAAGGGGAAGTVVPSVTVPSGWAKNDNAPSGTLTYNCTDKNKAQGATITLLSSDMLGTNMKTAKDYAQDVLNRLKDGDSKYTFSAITTTTVGGMDAAEFTQESKSAKQRLVYVVKGIMAYGIMCTVVPPEDYDKVSDDFQSMIDSYTLK